jgi:ubiquinone/menaquinone biosynthesis C-methylase UbiE
MSTIQQDFDRIALVSEDGGAHNDHYHNFLLRHIPSNCQNVLEIGCGTGGFARRLAEHCGAGSAGTAGSPAEQPGRGAMLPAVRVLALDLSPEMIRLARERSSQFPNIKFELADICNRSLPEESFDCIASIATLHHLPYAETLLKMKAALKPGGVLLVLDLFEPAGLFDSLSNLVAIPVSVGLRLIHHGRLLPRREERAAWAAHEAHDLYPTMSQVHILCASLLPGAKIRKHLLWRYSLVWTKVAA